MSGATSSVPASANPLGFSLSFVEGRGLLSLRGKSFFDLLTLDRLELEIPHLRFPFDVTGGASRFQHKRCLVHLAQVALEERRAESWLRARPTLPAVGASRLALRFSDQLILVSGRLQAGDHQAPFTAKATLEPAHGEKALLSIREVRIFGFVPLAAPQLGLALLAALDLGELRGTGELVFDPLGLLLAATLPAHGWRLPDRQAARLSRVEMRAGRLELSFARAGGGAKEEAPAPSARFAAQDEGRTLFRELEALLAAGDLEAAQAGWLRELERSGDHPFVAARLLQTLCARLSWLDRAESFAHETLRRRPGFAPALLALAQVATARGEHARAGERFGELAAACELAGDADDTFYALSAGAEHHLQADARRATPLFERALATRPRDGEVFERLSARYEAESRTVELAALLETRRAVVETPVEQARLCLRLGRLQLEQLGDPARARDELERAVRLDAADPEAWLALAAALEASGEPLRAIRAADVAARLHGERGDPAQVKAHLLAAGIWERAGDNENALLRLRRALELQPGDAQIHARAGRLLEQGERFEDAARAYAEAIERSSGPARALALVDLARVLGWGLGDVAAARARLDEALRDGEHVGALVTLGRLLERAGDATAAADAYLRAAASARREGDVARARALALERGRVLYAAGRQEEALGALNEAAGDGEVAEGAAAEAAAGAEGRPAKPPADEGARAAGAAPWGAPHPASWVEREALALLAELHGRRGDKAALRTVLTRWARAGGEGAAVALERLGLLDAAAGDLDAARARLSQAAELAADPRSALAQLAEVLARAGDTAACIDTLAALGAACDRAGDGEGAGQAARARGRALLASGRAEEAVVDLRLALSRLGEDPETLAALGDSEVARGAFDESYAIWQRLAELPMASGPGVLTPPELARRLAEAVERLGRPAEALSHWRQVLERGGSGALAQLAWKRMVRLLGQAGDHDAACRALETSAADPAMGEDAAARAARLAAAGEIARRRLGDPARARALYERALGLNPVLVVALDALEAMASAAGDTPRRAELLERKVAALARRPLEQLAVLARLCEVLAALGRDEEARARWEQALAIDPNHRPALLWLARSDTAAGDDAPARSRWEQILELGESTPEERLEATLALAQLSRGGGDDRTAADLARRALELDASSTVALVLLDEIYSEAGQHAELSDVLTRRVELERHPERLPALGIRHAALLADHLGHRREAIAVLQKVLMLSPRSTEALVHLAALARQEGATAELLEALSRLVEIVETGPPAAELGLPAPAALHLEIAELLRDRMGDPERACGHLERCLEADPRCTPALVALERLRREREDFAAVDALLGRRAALASGGDERAHLQLERARLRRERGDLAGARQLLEALGDEAPSEALELRTDLDLATGDAPAAATALHILASRAHGVADAPAESAALRRLAPLLETTLARPEEARSAWARLCELDPRDAHAAEALVGHAARAGAGERLAALERLREALRQGSAPPARVAEVLTAMADVLEEQGRLAEAADRLGEACALTDQPALRRGWAELAHRAGDSARAATLWTELAARTPDPLGAADALGHAAELYQGPIGDAPRARRVLAEALALCPPGGQRDQLLRRLAAAQQDAGATAEVFALLDQLGDRASEADLVALAEACERLGRVDEAGRAWQRLGEGSSAPEARRRLVALWRNAGRPFELAQALEQHAADLTSASERAALLSEAAALHLAVGDAEAATRAARAAQDIAPGESETLGVLAGTLPEAEMVELAERLSTAAPPGLRAQAWLLVADSVGKTERGAAALARAAALELDPERAAALRVREAELRARLLEKEGQEAEAEAALAAIVDLHPEPHQVLHRLSTLAGRRGDEGTRKKWLDALVRRYPDDAQALSDLWPLVRAAGDRERARQIGRRLADRTEPPEARGSLLLEVAQLCEPREAATLCAEAARLLPDPRLALERLVELGKALRDGDLELDALGRLHALADPAARGPLSLRIAELASSRGDIENARVAAWRAADELPTGAPRTSALTLGAKLSDDAGWGDQAFAGYVALRQAGEADADALSRLAALAAARGEPREQALALEALCARKPRLGLLTELGRLYAGPLHEPDRAAAVWTRAAEADPCPPEVLRPLADYHYQRDNLDAALDYYTRALALGGVPDADRAVLRTRIAEICRRTGDLVTARLALEEALAEQPGSEVILDGLEDVLRAQRNPVALAELLLRRARACPEQGGLARLREAVSLYSGAGLSDQASAVEEELAALDPDGHVLGRARKLAQTGAYDALAELIEQTAAEPPPSRRLLAQLAREAAARAESAGRLNPAAQLLGCACDLDPADREAPVALERVQRSRGDIAGASEALGRQLLGCEDKNVRAELWLRRARLYLEDGREPEAARCLREALSHKPDLIEAVELLRPLAERRGEWAMAAELCYREIAGARTPEAAAHLHAELGRLLEERLLDPEQARRNYEQALETLPDDAEVLQALARLAAASGRFADAAHYASRAADPLRGTARGQALLAAADYSARAGDRDHTKGLLAEAARIGTPDLAETVLVRLSQLEHHDPTTLANERAALLARLASDQPPAVQTAILRRLVELALELGETVQANQRALELLARAPGDPLAFAVRRRALLADGDAGGLASLYKLRAEHCDDSGERAGLLFQTAQLAEHAGDMDAAVAALDEALDQAPTHLEALHARAELAHRLQEWDRAEELYARIARTSPEAAAQVAFRRGEIAEVLGRHEEANLLLRLAAQAEPKNLAAREALARVLLARGELSEAIDELHTLEAMLPAIEVERLTSVRQQVGELAARLGRLADARAALELVLAHDPARTGAIELLAGVCAQLGLWEEAADLQGRLSRSAQTPAARAERLFRQGEIYRLELGDLERAGDCYLRASDLDPRHIPTLWRLVEYFFAARDWDQLQGVVRDLVAAGARRDDPLVRPSHLIITGLLQAMRGDVDAARSALTGASPAELASHAAFALRDGDLEAASAVAVAAPDLAALEGSLEALVQVDPADRGAHLLLWRLREQGGDARALLHRGVVAFLDDDSDPPASPVNLPPDLLDPALAAAAPGVEGPLRLALHRLARLLPPPPGLAPPAKREAPAELAALLTPVIARLEVSHLELALCAETHDGDPVAWPPALLLVPMSGLELPAAELRFTCARAIAALRSGLAPLLLCDASALAPTLGSIAERLRARPDVPSALVAVLEHAATRPEALAAGIAEMQLEANRAALAISGDLGAALRALARHSSAAERDRAACLREPALADLARHSLDARAGAPRRTSLRPGTQPPGTRPERT
jgi:tetratricopeptide (TPR) repeat protein